MDSRVVAIENYWASVVRGAEEFQQIAIAENPEFNKLAECIRQVLQESFIEDMSSYGVERWEKMLGIIPNLTDTLEDRKVRILTYLSLRLPYTWRVLQQMITSFVGENNFTMKFYNDFCKLVIKIKVENDNQYNMVMKLLKNVVPQNVVIDLTVWRGSVSDYENDVGYLTAREVKLLMPTKLSELENDSNYVGETEYNERVSEIYDRIAAL